MLLSFACLHHPINHPHDDPRASAACSNVQERNEGGCWRLLRELEAGVAAAESLTSPADVANLMQVLFGQSVEMIRGRRYCPIAVLQRMRAEQQSVLDALNRGAELCQQQQEELVAGMASLAV